MKRSLYWFLWRLCFVILTPPHFASTILKDNSVLLPFKCPSKEHFIVLGNVCKITAFQPNNPSDTDYEWTIKSLVDIDLDDPEFFMADEDAEELIIYNDNQIGEIHIKLIMRHKTRRKTRCDLKIIFFDTPHFGIDLGTTFSCIAYQLRGKDPKTNLRDTKIVMADTNRRQYCIPTAIYYPKHSDHLLFGQDAMNMISIDKANVIYDIKRIIGRTWSDKTVQNFTQNHLFTILQDPQNVQKLKIGIPNRNIQISPEQALASIVIHLVHVATQQLGVIYNSDINAVISIPAFFNNAQRRAIRSVAKLATINANLLVVEPTAAAIAHIYTAQVPRDYLKLFVIFDFGGGTLDCSVMKCHGMSCDVLAVSGNTALGGIDFDHVIVDIIVQKLIDDGEYKEDIDIASILRDAERIKKGLTVNDVESHKYKNKPAIIITKAEFESHEKTQKLLSEAIQTLNEAIEAPTKRFVSSNIRMILLVGGSSNIPVVKDTLVAAFQDIEDKTIIENTVKELQERFGDNFLTNIMKKIWSDSETKSKARSIRVDLTEMNPELMVITGSAILGGAMAFDTVATMAIGIEGLAQFMSNTVNIRDVIPLSLGFEVCIDHNECGKMSVMIAKNREYPLQVNKSYCQHNAKDDVVTMRLFEGDSPNIADNYFLSRLVIKNIVPRADLTKCNTFHMVFSIDHDGIAEIHGVTHNSDGSDAEIYTMSLSLLSKHESLTECEITQMQNEMVPWFESNKVKNLLKTTATTCSVEDSTSDSEPEPHVTNYVYLDGSASMNGFGFRSGTKVFNVIGPSLLHQETSITLFATRRLTVVPKGIKHWNVARIIDEWQKNEYIGGNTYMWHMILNDLLKNHTNFEEHARLTIITDGQDNNSPSPYYGLTGMDPMMEHFIKSNLKIEVNIIILHSSKWESSRYKDLCEATGGLFYHMDNYSDDGMKRFQRGFVRKYTEIDAVKIKERQKKQQEIYEENREGGKATVFDWYQDYKSLS